MSIAIVKMASSANETKSACADNSTTDGGNDDENEDLGWTGTESRFKFLTYIEYN